MKKKKLLALGMVAAMATTAVVGGTLAYFTDTDSANNTFAIGNVKIEQKEEQRKKDTSGAYTSELEEFEQDQTLVPAVNQDGTNGTGAEKEDFTVNDYTFPIRYNVKNYVDKIVTVKNTGKSDAYVRTIIAVPTAEWDAKGISNDEWLHFNVLSDTDTKDGNGGTKGNGWYWGKTESAGEWPAESDQYIVKNVMIGGVEYNIVVATNINVLDPNESTAPCLVGFYLDDDVNYVEDAKNAVYDKNGTLLETYTGYTMMREATNGRPSTEDAKMEAINVPEKPEIKVFTQAVQADGFESAWAAFEEAYGTITKDNHPWK